MLRCRSSGTASAPTPRPIRCRCWRGRSGAPGWSSTTACGSGRKRTRPGRSCRDTEVQRRVVTAGQADAGAGVAGRGGLGGAGAGLPGRPPGVPELVRLAVRVASGSAGGRRGSGRSGTRPSIAHATAHQPTPGVRGEDRDLQVEWSRPLPSVPSSCTVIREADGRYYVSFVVERAERRCRRPPRRWVSISVWTGSPSLSDGEIIDNPATCGAAQRRLGRAQRALARKQRGGAEPAQGRPAVAVLHRRVRETRLDAPSQAGSAVGPRQPSGPSGEPVRGRSGADETGPLDPRCGLVHAGPVDRGEGRPLTAGPSSRWTGCSRRRSCARLAGIATGPSRCRSGRGPARVCGVAHDRDLNAARNVLAEGRRIAAGLAEIENACGAGVRRGSGPVGRRRSRNPPREAHRSRRGGIPAVQRQEKSSSVAYHGRTVGSSGLVTSYTLPG